MGQSKLYLEDHFPSPLRHTWIEFRRSHVSMLGLWLLIMFMVVIIFAPGISPFSPTEQNTDVILLPPAWNSSGTIVHLFGTDSLGRDVLSRVIYGSRLTFGISIMLVLIAMLVGF